MATITKTIGTTGRDYATPALFEADLNDGVTYTGSDDAVGEMYADSDFTSAVSFNGTYDPATVTLTAADGEEHDGTAGSGVRWLLASSPNEVIYFNSGSETITVSKLEIDCNGYKPLRGIYFVSSAGTYSIHSIIIHNAEGSSWSTPACIRHAPTGAATVTYDSCILYDFDQQANSTVRGFWQDTNQDVTAQHMTIDNIRASGGAQIAYGVIGDNAGRLDLKNSIVTRTDADGNVEYDITSTNVDTTSSYTSDGTDATTVVVAADIFTSTTSGSEDYTPVSGASLAATDLGTGTDAKGVDRDTRPEWQAGAIQGPATVTHSIGTTGRTYSTPDLWEADLDDDTVYVSDDTAKGECYADSTFAYTGQLVLNGGGTIGLTAAELTAAVSDRHDGTAGSGVLFTRTGGTDNWFDINRDYYTISWLECDGGYDDSASNRIQRTFDFGSSAQDAFLHHMLVHNCGDTTGYRGVYSVSTDGTSTRGLTIHNNVFYNMSGHANGATIDCTTSGSRLRRIYNNTVHGTGNSANGIEATNNAYVYCQNNISVANGGDDFEHIGTSNGAYTYNISSDNTLPNDATNLESVTVADQFVSTTSGSEDFHLASTSDAIGAGADLGADYASDIDGDNRDATSRSAWSIGADEPSAEITFTIGTNSRNYSTIPLWEADRGDTSVYIEGDTAIGECYADSDFSNVKQTISTETAPNVTTLTAASGEEHDGTANSGVRIIFTSNDGTALNCGQRITVSWIEIDFDGYHMTSGVNLGSNSDAHHMLIHTSGNENVGSVYGISSSTTNVNNDIHNNFIYALQGNSASNGLAGINAYTTDQVRRVYNNTIFDITKPTTGEANGIRSNGKANEDVFNNLVLDVSNSSGADDCFHDRHADWDYNASSDTTAAGTNSLTNVVAADTFVSTTSGSEDLHLKTGASAIAAGADYSGVGIDSLETDIDGQDRDAGGRTWDIGADQLPGEIVKTIGTASRDYSTIPLWEADHDTADGVYISGDTAVGECYADSNFSQSSLLYLNRNSGSLAAITLKAAASDEHDGTLGSGVVVDTSYSGTANLWLFQPQNGNVTIEGLEFNLGVGNAGYGVNGVDFDAGSNVTNSEIKRCLWHSLEGDTISRSNPIYMNANKSGNKIHNNVFISTYYMVRGSYANNCTIYNNTGYGRGIGNGIDAINFSTSAPVANNLVANFSNDINGSWGTETTNATEDSTGQITGITPADEFVSTTAGSEDLHLASTSTVLGDGTDLGTTYEIDIDGQERLAVWDIGADRFEGAITTSIGTASRDYSTITLFCSDGWNADDIPRGECYADSTFTENAIRPPANSTLTAASGEEHDGTAGSGVVVQPTGSGVTDWILCPESTSTISWLEFDLNEVQDHCDDIIDLDDEESEVAFCIIHGGLWNDSSGNVFLGGEGLIHNNIVYNHEINVSGTGRDVHGYRLGQTGQPATVVNNTFYNFATSSDGDAIGMATYSGSNKTFVNNLIGDVTTTGSGGAVCINEVSTDALETVTNNVTDDTTGQVTNATMGFTSTTAGSEDFHLTSSSDAINEGTDASATIGTSVDIDNVARTGTWDAGADQYVSTGASGTVSVTLDDVTTSSAAESIIDAIVGVSLDGITTTSAAVSPVDAGVTATLDGITVDSAGEGTTVSGSGTLSVTLGGITTVSAGVSPIEGTTSSTLDGITTVSVGALAATGTAAVTLDGITVAAASSFNPEGTLAVTLDGITTTSVGSSYIEGAASVTLDGITVSAGAGGASAVFTLDGITMTSAAASVVAGAVGVTLDDLTAVSVGEGTIEAILGISLDGITSTGQAESDISASGAITLDGVTMFGVGTVTASATLSVQLDGIVISSSSLIATQLRLFPSELFQSETDLFYTTLS